MQQSPEQQNRNNLKSITLKTPLKALLYAFYYMGLTVFPDGSTFKLQTKLHNLYQMKFCICSIVGVLILSILFWKNPHMITYDNNFSKFNNALKFIIVIVAHQITLWETLVTRNTVVEFFQAYSQLHSRWSTSTENWRNALKLYRQLFLYCGSNFLVIALVEISYAVEIRNQSDWMYFYLMYTPSVVICRCRILQIIMYLELIRIELLHLNRQLLVLAKRMQHAPFEWIEELIEEDMIKCMRVYEQIFEMSELFKQSTSLSILAIFVKSYVILISDFYWSYWVIYNEIQFNGKMTCVR